MVHYIHNKGASCLPDTETPEYVTCVGHLPDAPTSKLYRLAARIMLFAFHIITALSKIINQNTRSVDWGSLNNFANVGGEAYSPISPLDIYYHNLAILSDGACVYLIVFSRNSRTVSKLHIQLVTRQPDFNLMHHEN